MNLGDALDKLTVSQSTVDAYYQQEEGEKILSSNISVIMPTTGIVKTITFATVFQGSNLYLKKINQTMPA